jgi:uncharacterized membrane protein
LTERTPPIGTSAAQRSLFAPAAASKDRWLIGAVLLGVGLVVGFAGGVAVVTQSGAAQGVSVPSPISALSNRVIAELPRAEVQPPPVRPAPSRLTDEPIVRPRNDAPLTTETVGATAEPEPVTTGPRASLTPAEAVPDSPVAALYVQSNPAGAEVYLDDRLVSTTPFQLSDIAPGRHTIRIELEGYRTWSAQVNVEPGARRRISAALAQ